MSKRPFRRRLRQSFGAVSKTAPNGQVSAKNPLISKTADLLARIGAFGCLWLDQSMFIRARFGRLVDTIPVGVPVGEAVLALFGMEDQIAALCGVHDRTFQIPNVAVVANEEGSPRLNITVIWMPTARGYLVLVSRALARDDLEIELTRQTRRRMLSEAQLVEQSKAIAAANIQLSRANQDLEEFTAIVSHDLRAPMRALRSTTEDLARALGDPSGGDPHEHLDRLNRQSRRMSGMLTSLLTYVRLDRDSERDETFSTRDLIDDIISGLPERRGVVVSVTGTWPTITARREPLDLVLRNLIDNALKHHDRAPGQIVVCAEPGTQGTTFTIDDDGPGIPINLQETVFRPFTRLSSCPASSEGVGMGLTLVQRAVQRAGAQLRLTSDPDSARGTRFTLHWPHN